MKAIGMIIGLGFLAASGFMNFEFAYELGRTPVEAMTYGLVGVLAVATNGASPFLLAWNAKQHALQVGICVLWILCLSYSLSAAIGFAAENREGRVGPREALRANYETTMLSLSELEAKRAKSRKKWRYDEEIEALRVEAKRLREAGANEAVDPQGEVLATLMFIGGDNVRLILNIIFGVLVELGAALVLFASASKTVEPARVKPPMWRPKKQY